MASASDVQDIFTTLSSKITQLSFNRTNNDRNLINKALDDLNSLNYKYTITPNRTKAALLVNHCCSLIPPEDTELARKCCRLITDLITRQKVVINGRTLTMTVHWCLLALNGDTDDIDILIALDALLRNAAHDLVADVVKNEKIALLSRTSHNSEVAFHALQCLESCTVPVDDIKSTDLEKYSEEHSQCFQIFLNHIQSSRDCDNAINTKIQLVCLRGLQNLVKQRPQLLENHLGLVLGAVKSFSLLGIDGVEFMPVVKLIPASLSVPEQPTYTREKGRKMTRQRKPKTQPVVMKNKNDDDVYKTPALNVSYDDVKTSDSDFSDTEGGNIALLKVMKGRVRQAALTLLLHTINSLDRAVMFSYWTGFVPENPTTSKHNLITCILKETSNKGRMIALNALLLLLSSSKQYLAQAEKGEAPSFTPFSVVLGFTINELHKCLSLALTEQSIPVLNMVLKCFACLVQATPYYRLAPGLIGKVVRNVKPFVFHKNSTVQVTALVVLGCVLASEPRVPETGDVLFKSGFWLLDRCLSQLASDTVATSVKLECLQIISATSRNYFEFVRERLRAIVDVLDANLSSRHSDVQLHSARTVEYLGQAMSGSVGSAGLWCVLLNGALPSLLQCEQSILKAAACDCLGTIGASVFEELARDKQILCATLLLACSRDEESGVRGAAVRALGIFVLYPSLREDEGFVLDTTEAIVRIFSDENYAVKIKCSWALGNLSDALVVNKCSSHVTEEFPEMWVLKLFKLTIGGCSEGDKIKVNAVRALGNFLQLIDIKCVENEAFEDVVRQAMDVFVRICRSGSNMKVKWNCCYAAGNAMKNPVLFSLTPTWQDCLFDALSDLVVNHRNFKVRINAAAALAAPQKREFYNDSLQPIWDSLVKALETSQQIEDLNEYKHRDGLIEQICLTLSHLMTLLLKEDVNLLARSDHLKMQMVKVWDRLLPEKTSVLYKAHEHVTSLSKAVDLNVSQRTVLENLLDVLHHEF